MSSNSKVAPATRRRTLIGLAGLAASASGLKMAWGTDPGPFVIKRASLLQRKPGISRVLAKYFQRFCAAQRLLRLLPN